MRSGARYTALHGLPGEVYTATSVIRRTLSIAVAALVAFHVWVLGDQLRVGALSDPALAARWIIAGGLVWAAITFHRRGLSLIWSRQAVAVWSLAALLHGPAILQRSTAADPLLPEVAATVAQIAVVAAGVGLTAEQVQAIYEDIDSDTA